MRAWIAAAAVLIVTATAVSVALATSVHWKHGSPDFTDNGLTLTETGTVAGVGNGDLLVTLVATANPTATCSNPGNTQHLPPGQNPAPITVTGSVSIPASAIKNGNASYTVTTNPPTSPIPGAPGCPNSQWTQTITDLAFTSGNLTIVQNGIAVFGGAQGACTFSPPTSNGPVSASAFTCPN